ncbi:MAG: PQQ-dependent sugar dehydrogenase [Desulfonatronovibrio sp.]
MSRMFSGYLLVIFMFTLCSGLSFIPPVLGDPVVGDAPQQIKDHYVPEPDEYEVESWIEDLRIPWSLVFISEEKALVTERSGRIRLVINGAMQREPYKIIDETEHVGEGGLMGLAKHPDYHENKYLYLMHTYRENNELYNRVVRYLDTGETMELDRIIVDRIPGHRVHNGGRIAFGPDNMLYVCTGDVGQPETAQDIDNLGGKILRLTPSGDIPEDNPFEGSPVYSLGHRNPQGLAWHPKTGDLFSSEHGPSGEFGLQGRDIINLIEKGGNYGWPHALGEANLDEYIDPLIMWMDATPPSGMTFWNNRLYLATLRSEALIRMDFQKAGDSYEPVSIDRLFADGSFSGIYGRLRAAVVGPDGALYVLTSNLDGRGKPREGDDKILRLTRK